MAKTSEQDPRAREEASRAEYHAARNDLIALLDKLEIAGETKWAIRRHAERMAFAWGDSIGAIWQQRPALPTK